MFITDGEKHLNFFEDGRNECWLVLISKINYDHIKIKIKLNTKFQHSIYRVNIFAHTQQIYNITVVFTKKIRC